MSTKPMRPKTINPATMAMIRVAHEPGAGFAAAGLVAGGVDCVWIDIGVGVGVGELVGAG